MKTKSKADLFVEQKKIHDLTFIPLWRLSLWPHSKLDRIYGLKSKSGMGMSRGMCPPSTAAGMGHF